MAKQKRESYTDLFLKSQHDPSPAAKEAAAVIDRLLFDSSQEFDMLTTVLELIQEGWGYGGTPSPPMIAAALLNEAEGYKHDLAHPKGNDTVEEAITDTQGIAAEILKPYLPQS